MSTSQTAFKKAFSRIGAVSAVLGIALAAGTATAASAAAVTPLSHPSQAAAPAGGHGDDGGCDGLIILLCN
ncbi:hypothetical protein AQI95_12385 [Streptomyces yokosukanensis]|uniref:Chaplin domain-containing protein n=1 Tax=Streptomyces yokosukanensis TaxID=67386 RepID=A0A101P854_9ACTN|nr:hypothetical protein [Streptomyces yokosukanensis]KUN06668.1 hypothetical protein AQI95_12385 [Streptomyces yokosukanensis]